MSTDSARDAVEPLAPPPNFLFLIADQLRADHVGFSGNAIVRTPHLDALAARATVFDRAYVANPVCMPNRASIMTGRMPSVHGTRCNGIALDAHANTFVRRLHAAGYRTSHIGKSHLQTMGISRARLRQSENATIVEDAWLASAAPGWDEHENVERYRDGAAPECRDFYGFERAQFAILHGDHVTGHYEHWLRAQGHDPARITGWHNALARYDGWNQVYQTALPVDVHPSSYVAQQTIAELAAAKRDGRPFCIHASWPDPHHPFTPPGHYYGMFDPDAMPLPRTFADKHADSLPHYRQMLANRGHMLFRGVDGWAPTADQFRHALAAEYGCLALLDDCVGQILAALAREGLADNTVVVFTSDHGDMFGDHGILLKHAMHYAGCIRVPLLIARPGQHGSRVPALVSSIDLAPTLLDLAGVAAFHGIQGHSLSPLLDAATASVRDSVLIEEDEQQDMTGAGVPTRMRTLVCDEGRLTVYQGHTHGELFAAADGDEMRNLYAKPRGRKLREQLRERLLEAMLAHADTAPRPRYMA